MEPYLSGTLSQWNIDAKNHSNGIDRFMVDPYYSVYYGYVPAAVRSRASDNR